MLGCRSSGCRPAPSAGAGESTAKGSTFLAKSSSPTKNDAIPAITAVA
jgi:hypothetical protein